VSVAANAGALAEGRVDRAAEADPDILGGVVVIDVQITARPQVEIDQRVAGEQIEHVIEKTDPAVALPTPAAIEQQLQLDIGFAGASLDGGLA
jgi:hypothetical protein